MFHIRTIDIGLNSVHVLECTQCSNAVTLGSLYNESTKIRTNIT